MERYSDSMQQTLPPYENDYFAYVAEVRMPENGGINPQKNK